MTEHEKTKGCFFKGLLIGSAFGALAGILFAPKSGKELRSEIKEKGIEVLTDGTIIYSDVGTKAKELIEEVKQQAMVLKTEAEGAGEKIADGVKEKIGQVKKVFGQ